jgi:hypothetical protein
MEVSYQFHALAALSPRKFLRYGLDARYVASVGNKTPIPRSFSMQSITILTESPRRY